MTKAELISIIKEEAQNVLDEQSGKPQYKVSSTGDSVTVTLTIAGKEYVGKSKIRRGARNAKKAAVNGAKMIANKKAAAAGALARIEKSN